MQQSAQLPPDRPQAGGAGTEAASDRLRPTVCVMDTGISAAGVPRGTLLDGANLSGHGDAQDLSDGDNRHGSLVAQTILRQAPAARLVVLKVLDGDGTLGDRARIDAAFEWVREHREALGISVVCAAFADMSHWRSDAAFRDSRLCRLVADLRSQGVATVMPAGNWYPQFRFAQPQGMAWPAVLREVVSIGALDPAATPVALHPYSQRLHARSGTGCRTTAFAVPGPPGDTSGAAAVAAGRLALLRQTRPAASVESLLDDLVAKRCTAGDDHGESWPVLALP